jgi:putative membrane protein
MADDKPNEQTSRFQVRATAESHFSWLRTRMSIERTLMSWVRTSTALIGFGFTIFQFLYRFNKTPGVEPPEFPWAPWFLGLGLIGTGLVALIISVWEYRSMVRYLWEKDFKPIAGVDEFAHHTPVVAVSVVLILIGIFAFVAVLFRVP